MRFSILTLLTTAASVSLAAPATAQHSGHMPGMNMPGMTMPTPKKATPKKPAAQKPAAKKPVAKKAVAKRLAKPTAKPTARKATTSPVARSRTPDPPAGHDMSGITEQRSKAADPHAGHDMSAMPQKSSPTADPHAGHDMSAMPQQQQPSSAANPHAGHDMSANPQQPSPAVDPHAGHDMSNMPQGGMAGHDMSAMNAAPSGTDLPAGDGPPPPVPTANAADAIYGSEAMAMGRHHLMQFHGGQKLAQVLVNVAEVQVRKGREAFEWDAEGWYGGDINRLWVKSEGEGEFGRSLEKAEIQALYSRAVGPYFNLQGGLRYDFKPNPSRVYATVGVEGLAPSFFDIEGALFLSNKGELMARAEGSYDQRITQRLILQPRAELNFAAQNSREIGVGAGLSDAELGLRLRYDIRREFAPYVGVQYRRAFGRTRDYLRDEGEDASSWSLLTGVRLWF